MVDPQTINKFLTQPPRGGDSSTWEIPTNANMAIADNSFGGVASIAVTSSPVTLLSSQYQCVLLNVTGALNANVAITLPAVGSFYTVMNSVTNTSAFYVSMGTTVAGGKQIGLPSGTTDIMTDGSNVRFRSLPYVGSYWYYSGSSTPAWVSACTTPPWLYCNGTTFSSGSYPILNSILGSTTLPDLRGRTAAYFNDGTGRITSSLAGINGDVLYSAGGNQTVTLSQANLPAMNFPVTDPGHTHPITVNNAHGGGVLASGGGAVCGGSGGASITVNSQVTGISVASGGSNLPFPIVPPAGIAGITMVRAG